MVKKRAKSLKQPLNVVSERLFNVAENTAFIIELFRYKTYLLAKGITHAIETENPISLANNTRSLLEQVAVFAHCTSSVEKMLVDLKNQGSINKINSILEKAEKSLQRTYSGQGKKTAKTKEDEAIHVHDAIAVLSAEVSDATDAYDYLCEFVHPNHGNNLLVSSGEIGRGKITTTNKNSEHVKRIAKYSPSILDYLDKKIHLHTLIAWKIYHLVEICFQKGAKIENIFSERPPIPLGDGKSRETAFYFKNARTSQEAIKLSYQYITNIGHDPYQTKRSSRGASEGYVFDVWETAKGDVWFRIPFYKGIH